MKILRFITVGSTLTLVVLLSSCGTPEKKIPDKAEQIERYTSTIRGQKEVVDPVHGKEVAFFYGAVSGVGETIANGVAFIHAYEDGTSIVTVNLNVLVAPQGQEYEAFLSGGAEKPIALGVLRSIIGDVRHNAELETRENLADRRVVTVKLGDTTIAEGTVKVQEAPIN